MISNAINTGIQGYQRASHGMEQSAANLQNLSSQVESPEAAKATGATGSIEEHMVELKLYEMNAKASTKVIERGDQMLGTLLDTNA